MAVPFPLAFTAVLDRRVGILEALPWSFSLKTVSMCVAKQLGMDRDDGGRRERVGDFFSDAVENKPTVQIIL